MSAKVILGWSPTRTSGGMGTVPYLPRGKVQSCQMERSLLCQPLVEFCFAVQLRWVPRFMGQPPIRVSPSWLILFSLCFSSASRVLLLLSCPLTSAYISQAGGGLLGSWVVGGWGRGWEGSCLRPNSGEWPKASNAGIFWKQMFLRCGVSFCLLIFGGNTCLFVLANSAPCTCSPLKAQG